MNGNTTYIFATSESVSSNDYIGCGNSSSNILRNTIVVPNNCQATKMAFNIRELSQATSYTARLYVNNNPTSFTAVIPDGSVSYGIISPGNITLNQLDLITIKITFANGALNNGACITLITN